MVEKETGGCAFPACNEANVNMTMGMTLRDYFAGRCPKSWLDKFFPKTLGDIRDAMIRNGILPISSLKADVLKSYDDSHVRKLYAVISYEYADAMLEARK